METTAAQWAAQAAERSNRMLLNTVECSMDPLAPGQGPSAALRTLQAHLGAVLGAWPFHLERLEINLGTVPPWTSARDFRKETVPLSQGQRPPITSPGLSLPLSQATPSVPLLFLITLASPPL